MQGQVYPDGTEIVVLDGELKGEYGVVVSYEAVFDRYFVHLPQRSLEGHFAFRVEEISPLDEAEDEEDSEEDVPPGFGMSEEDFVAHLEFLIGRSLTKVVTTGAAEAFFGYQEFEGLTAEDALLKLLDKIEEGIAHLAQAHILISRIGVTYRTIMREIADDRD